MATINVSIINVSLPTLVVQLQTDFASIQWVILSFLLVVTVLMLSAARLGDMIGKTKIYLTGLFVFTIGSLLCGLSPSVGWLIGFRAIQGIGGVMMQALGAAIVTEVFPPDERGKALGIVGGTISIGLAMGPAIGGILIGLGGWRSIFWVNVPLGVIAWLVTRRFVPALAIGRLRQRFDIIGALILLITLLCYALAMTLGQNRGFDDKLILGLLAGTCAGLAGFLIIEAKVQQPMMDLMLFKNLLFGVNLLMGLLVFIVIGGFFIMPFFLELVKGYRPEQVGMLMMVVPVFMGLVSLKAGAFSDRFGPRAISFLGLLIMTGGCLTTSTLNASVSPLGYVLRLAPIGIGFGMFQAPNNSAIMGAPPRKHLGMASGLLALSRNLGNTTGLPLFGAIFSAFVLSEGGAKAMINITTAPSESLVRGITGTYQLAALLVLVPTILAALAWWLDRGRIGKGREKTNK